MNVAQHLKDRHGHTPWYIAHPSSREYKSLKRDHETLYHGRWQDQQDHTHDEQGRVRA